MSIPGLSLIVMKIAAYYGSKQSCGDIFWFVIQIKYFFEGFHSQYI